MNANRDLDLQTLTTSIPGNGVKVSCRIGVIWYLLHIFTVDNVFSYGIVLFQLESLWTRSSGTRQRMGWWRL